MINLFQLNNQIFKKITDKSYDPFLREALSNKQLAPYRSDISNAKQLQQSFDKNHSSEAVIIFFI
jgi:hypothetical protein